MLINNLKMIWLVYLLRNTIKFNFDFPFFLFSTWHCRVAMQFEYCFSIIGLYIDIYGYGMLSMAFWLLSRRNIISFVWRNWIRLKLISSSYLPIDRYAFSRRPWKYHSARQSRLDWTCFTSLVKFYLVSRKTFLLYSILTFHKVVFFITTENWSAYIFLFVLYNIYVAELNTEHGTVVLLCNLNIVFQLLTYI